MEGDDEGENKEADDEKEGIDEDDEEEDMDKDNEEEDMNEGVEDEDGEVEAVEDDNKENIVAEENEDIDKLACEDIADDIVECEQSKAAKKVEANDDSKLIEDLKAIISNGELKVKRKRTRTKAKKKKSMDTSINSVTEQTSTPATPVVEKEESSDKKENSNKKGNEKSH